MEEKNDKARGVTKGKKSASGEPESAEQKMDSLKEILFGKKEREIDDRFTMLEERIGDELSNMKTETNRKFESVEAHFKKEMDVLDEKIESLRNELNKNVKDIRHKMHEDSERLTEDISSRFNELKALINKEIKNLRINKTSRSEMAALLNEVALNLTNELDSSSEEA